MAQTIDFTADGGNRVAAGIRSVVQQHGGVEYHTLILDEAKIAAYFAANSITAANDDIYQLIDVKKGDMILSGFSYVEVAGGTAASAPIFGVTGDTDGLSGVFDPDATAGTLVSGTLAAPQVYTVDDTLDLTVVTQILIRSSGATGRWRLGVAILRANQALTAQYESFSSDANTPPQT